MNNTIYNKVSVFFIALYVTLVVSAPFFSTKAISLQYDIKFMAGTIVAMLAWQIIDVINELFNKEQAQTAVIYGLVIKAFVFLIIAPLILSLPTVSNEIYIKIFQTSIRIFFATEFSAAIQNLLVDIPIFDKLKKYKIGFFIRSNLSNIVSWTLASIIFVFVGFYGTPLFSMGLFIGSTLIRYPLSLLYTIIASIIVKIVRNIGMEKQNG